MAASPPPVLSEIREADASPRIAAIYADICAASGIPQVNLIYRHLATAPDVLDWVWQTLAPAFRNGAVARAAADVVRVAASDGARPLWHGLDPPAAAGVEHVLAFYNRANPQNLVALTALVMAARGEVQTAAAPVAAVAAGVPSPLMPLPPLPRRETLEPAISSLIDDLAARQGSGAGVTPSLYLHLALWPEAVRAAAARVGPLVGTPDFTRRVEAVVAEGGRQAARLARTLGMPEPRPAEAVLRQKLSVVDDFVGATIPQMVVVGRILAGASAAG